MCLCLHMWRIIEGDITGTGRKEWIIVCVFGWTLANLDQDHQRPTRFQSLTIFRWCMNWSGCLLAVAPRHFAPKLLPPQLWIWSNFSSMTRMCITGLHLLPGLAINVWDTGIRCPCTQSELELHYRLYSVNRFYILTLFLEPSELACWQRLSSLVA